MFTFFLKSYRYKILDFCGSYVDVDFNINSEDGKFIFRSYDNGDFKFKTITSRHSNIVKGVITGKKSWGLWLSEWTDGICEGSFSKREILQQFEDCNIKIPECLLNDFENTLYRKMKNKFFK